MNNFMKKLISVCLSISVILCFIVPTYAQVAQEEKKSLIFFGSAESYETSEKDETYVHMLGDYLTEVYNKNKSEVLNLADKNEGLKSGFYKLDNYENGIKPLFVFLSFNGSETEKDMAYAEGIIRKLYDKNNSVTVNFILLPDSEENTDVSKIQELADYYEIFVHNIRNKEELLKKYGMFNIDELFLNGSIPTTSGHETIARIIINDLKLKNCQKSISWKDKAIYEEIILGFDHGDSSGVLMTKKEIYCSVDGDDKNSGEITAPVKTIPKVMELISDASENSDIAVYFREGNYDVDAGVVIDSELTKNKKISFVAYNNEKVVLTNSYTVNKELFKKVTDSEILKRLPEEARGKVLKIDLTACNIKDEGGFVRHGVWQETPSALQLIVDDKIQSISRWPNNDFEKILSASGRTITVDTDRINRWTTAKEGWLYGYLGNYFADDSVPIENIDVNNKTITVAKNPSYAFSVNHSWSVINLLEEIDIPGEWFLDHSTNILYYFPIDGFENKEVRISEKAETLFTLNNTKNVSFKGLIFDGTRGYALEINECDNTLIENCEIRNTGRNAVNLRGRNNVVRDCYIHDTGRGGVWITGGGDTKNLTPSNNLIEYCRFENLGMYARTYVPAIKLYGVGDVASHNQISSGLGIAIDFKGKKNIIEYNEIFNWLFEGGDIGTIYCGRTWTTVGTEIRYNYIHDCPGADDVQAIYLDDGMIGVSVYGNVIENVTRGIYLHYGSYNNVSNNVIVDCETAIIIRNPLGATDKMAETANKELAVAWAEGTQDRYDKYGFYTKYHTWLDEYVPNADVYDLEYPYVKNAPYDGLFIPKNNIFEKNIYACGLDYMMSDAMKPNQTFKDNYTLTKEEMKEFDLSKVNEAYGSKIPGFIPVDIENVGLRNKPDISDVELLEPLNESSNVQAIEIDFSWKRVNEAVRYELLIANDKEFKDIVYKSETDKNKIYHKVENLKYGGKTYYWKVKAYDETDRVKESKIHTFATAEREIVDKTLLRNNILKAQNAYKNSTEGDEPGQSIAGSRELLNKYIISAERIFKSKSANQKNVDKTNDILVTQMRKFDASKNYVIRKINVTDMLDKENGWTGMSEIYKFEKGKVNLTTAGSIGFTGKKVETDQVLKFKLKLSNVGGTNWISFGTRMQNVEIQPWGTQGYIFLVKEDVIELQKFNNGKTFYFTIPNEYLKNDTEYEVEFGAVTMGNGESVRIYLVVDGKTLFDYIDLDDQVAKPGYFSIYSAGAKAEITPSEEIYK